MQEIFPAYFPTLLVVAKVLSGITGVFLVAACLNVWLRQSFPDVSYGGLFLSQRRVRWVWFLVLLGAFGVGINEDPVAVSTRSMEDPEARAAGGVVAPVPDDEGTDLPDGNSSEQVGPVPSKTVSLTLPTPFYRYDRQRIYVDDALVSEQIVEGILVPWSLLWALLAYWVLVVRWNPERGLARRILWGRRWKRESME